MISIKDIAEMMTKGTEESINKMVRAGLVGSGVNGMGHLSVAFAGLTALCATTEGMAEEPRRMMAELIVNYVVKGLRVDASVIAQQMLKQQGSVGPVEGDMFDEG